MHSTGSWTVVRLGNWGDDPTLGTVRACAPGEWTRGTLDRPRTAIQAQARRRGTGMARALAGTRPAGASLNARRAPRRATGAGRRPAARRHGESGRTRSARPRAVRPARNAAR